MADPNTVGTVITGTVPANGTVGVPLNTLISIQASRGVNLGTVNGSTFSVQDTTSGQFIAGQSYTQSGDGTTVNFVPPGQLVANHNYRVTTGSIKDVTGATIPGLQWTFTTGTGTLTTAPQVLLVQPPDGTTNVAVNTNVRVRFSATVNTLTVSSSTVGVIVGGQTQAPETVFFSNNNQDVVLVLHEPLPDNTQITVTVAGVKDLAGNVVASQTTHFTTGSGPDVAGPFVISEAPFSGQTGVPLNAVVNIELSEPMDFGTVNGSTFGVRDNTAGGVFIGGSYQTSADNRTMTFIPTAPLAAG